MCYLEGKIVTGLSKSMLSSISLESLNPMHIGDLNLLEPQSSAREVSGKEENGKKRYIFMFIHRQ